ncbi:MAG TPA: ATP-binding cassette domain-containing protein [Chitinophagales bacterium]|nr:ATP-binding cassette domain-containing protein [Chitinophagales bacterium]
MMLQANHITKYFNRGTPSEILALDHVSLPLAEKEFLVIIGSNGSGKTTLLNIIAGNYFPDEGTILINGINVTSKADFERSKWMSRVFQDPLKGTAPDLTIIDNFRLASLRTRRKGFRIGINPQFRNFVRGKISVLNLGLEDKLDTLVGKLSGGQRQALTLLMAAMDEPKILLLDEPTAALDPRSAEIVIKLADQLIREQHLTAILVTHNLRQALDYGSRLMMMDKGKITYDFSDEKKKNLQLREMQEWFV